MSIDRARALRASVPEGRTTTPRGVDPRECLRRPAATSVPARGMCGRAIAWGPRLSAVAVLAAVALAPRASLAFCRTYTVPTDPSFNPADGKCWEQGFPLWWRNSCVGYSIQRISSRHIAYDDVSLIAANGFGQWAAVSCPTDGEAQSRVSIDVRDIGPADCGEVKTDLNGPNQNVIVFRDDDWPHPGGNNQIALTTVKYSTTTGEIWGADMEINTFNIQLAASDPVGPQDYDLASVMTHEAGHFLGLAHSADKNATMYFEYHNGNTKMRVLSADDVAGVCSVYRPDGDRVVLDGLVKSGGSCDPTPKNGFSKECSDASSKSCLRLQIAAPSRDGERWSALTLGLVALLAGRMRARTRGKRRDPDGS